MPESRQLIITPAGSIRFVYADELAPLLNEGIAHVARASRVEPSSDGRDWLADLSLVGGPLLGPFQTRGAALTAEIGWIEENELDRGVLCL